MKTEQKRIITISGNGKVSVPVNVQMRDFKGLAACFVRIEVFGVQVSLVSPLYTLTILEIQTGNRPSA